jgi:hypothetical protein
LVGVLLSGLLLTYARNYFSPGGLAKCISGINFITQVLGINLINWPSILIYMVPFSAMTFGAIDVCIACYTNERYGANQFAIIFGTILSLGCVGNVISEAFIAIVVLPKIDTYQHYKAWTIYLFVFMSVVAGIGFLCAIFGY